MKLQSKEAGAVLAASDLLVVFAFKNAKPALPGGVALPQGALAGFDGSAQAVRVSDAARSPAKRVAVIGLGPKAELDVEGLRRAGAVAAKQAEELKAGTLNVGVDDAVSKAVGGAERAGQALAEGVLLGAYRFDGYKRDRKPPKLKTATLWGSGAAFRRGVKAGVALAAACAHARDLGNQPGNKLRPRDVAAAAKKLAARSPRITCKVLGEAEMKKLGMGSLLSVSAGSVEPACLVHLVYRPAGPRGGGTRKKRPKKYCVVGKGLTFDAGGISLKPSAKMWDMKYDMCGGAAVLGLFHALGELDVPHEVHGLVPSSENLPDAAATKPGDLVQAMDGTTIEVLNTDAEGRLILCDALCYAVKKIKPDTIVDLATLTGAVVMAVGHEYSGLFATSDGLRDELVAAGAEVGEALWPLPLDSHHKEALKGEVGDLKNIALGDVGAGSTIGAAFLSHFVGDTEWAHLDIAGAAWGGRNRDWVGGPQASGVGPRLLHRWLSERR